MRRILPGAVLAILLLLCGALWLERFALAQGVLARALARQDLAPASFRIEAIGADRFAARDISLRGGAIRATALRAAFTPLGLLRGQIARLEIDGLALDLAMTGDGITAGGRPLALSGGGGFAIDSLHLDAARLELETPSGPLDAAFAATLALSPGKIALGDLQATIEAPVAGARRRLKLAVPALSLTTTGGRIAGEAARATVQVEDLPVNLPPLALSGKATLENGTLAFTGAAELDAAGGKGKVAATATGRHDLATGAGEANIVVAPVHFRPGGLQPADFIQPFAVGAENFTGAVALGGTLRWREGKISPDLLLRVDDLGFEAGGATVRRIAGAVRIDRLWPPATPPGQSLRLALTVAGLPPAEAKLSFELKDKPLLHVERLAVAVAGGEISAADFDIDPAAPRIDTTLALDRVELAEIVRLLGIDGLSGSGALSGRIPLGLSKGAVTVAAGRLAAAEPGVLRYRPQKLPQAIAGAGQPMELALSALEDFHYQSLALSLDKSASGEGTVLLRLSGNNPAVLEGRMFNLNIRIEANFDRLVDYALLGLNSAQELLRRARRGSGQ